MPDAFGDDAILFGVAYLFVRMLHIALFALAARGDRDMLGSVFRLGIGSTIGPALIICAGFTDGAPQAALWAIALTLDYLGGAFSSGGWRVSPGHFAERHGLIIIIALGESIVAIGVGARGEPIDAGVIAAALLGIAVVTALWWSYFDVVAIVAERKLTELSGVAQASLARDTYSYLHLPMVAGIVLFALGAQADARPHRRRARARCRRRSVHRARAVPPRPRRDALPHLEDLQLAALADGSRPRRPDPGSALGRRPRRVGGGHGRLLGARGLGGSALQRDAAAHPPRLSSLLQTDSNLSR